MIKTVAYLAAERSVCFKKGISGSYFHTFTIKSTNFGCGGQVHLLKILTQSEGAQLSGFEMTAEDQNSVWREIKMFFGPEMVSPKQRCRDADGAAWKQLWFGFSLGSAESRFHGLAPGRRATSVFVSVCHWEGAIVTFWKSLEGTLHLNARVIRSQILCSLALHLWNFLQNGPGQTGSHPVQVSPS